MNIDQLRAYCLAKKGTTESFPFDQHTLVFKVMGKMFCLAGLQRWERDEPAINLKCDPDQALDLRDQYPDTVLPGYHMDKKHWNTICINRDLDTKAIQYWIDHSYQLIVNKLSKAQKQSLNNS